MNLFFKNTVKFFVHDKPKGQKIRRSLLAYRYRTAIFFSFFVLFSIGTKAQVFPPVFQCVVNDTLVWQLPNNNCGTFNSYEIFYSNTLNGPYQLLTTITNQNQTEYYHNNPTGETWYYYIVSDYNCPGEPVLSSDTLNNLPPEISRIIRVSVNGGNVEIDWQASPSPEVSYYIIYRTTPQGTLPIDTVSSLFTSYLDTGAQPDLQPELYYVIATDECGNTSVFDLPHITIHVDDVVDPCKRTILLKWNLYENWANGIESQELWYSVNGSTPTVLDTLPSTDSTYVFKNTNDGDSYCFFIKVTESNTGEVSFSNVHCLDLDVVEPVRSLFLKNVSVNAANQVELTWLWNDDAEIRTVNVQGIYEDDEVVYIENFNPTFPLSIENSQPLVSFDPSQNKIYFTIETIDDCDSIFTSNDGSTIFLTGTPNDDLTNTISWTDFDIEGGTVLSYNIFRVVDGAGTFVETVDANTTEFSNKVDVSNESEANVCYYVIADVNMQLPDGIEEQIKSRSNTICVEQLSNIISPNAFAPDGINKEFKPVIIFGETAEYLMVIYDRWGRKIFETQSQEEGWAGRNGIKIYPSGVYAYYIRIQQSSGRIVEDKGTVILLR